MRFEKTLTTKYCEQLSTRCGMMLAVLGTFVGTGNIMQLPRIRASNGEGEFLVD